MRTRFTARALIVGDRAGTVVPDAVLDVADGLISWAGPAASAPPADGEVVELPGVVLPGLVNTHSHAPMVLFRGLGEGLPLERWLREVMWPREARLTGDDVEVAMAAASAELLANGVTTSVEMYFAPERIAAAVRTTGARAVIATPLLTLPGFPPLDEQLAKAVELAAAAAPADGVVEYGLGPHAAYTLPLPLLTDAARAAREHGLLLHLHVAETVVEDLPLRAEHGCSVPALLAANDVLGGRVLAAHCVHLDDADLELWRAHDVAVAHCPASNAKLASGVAPLRRMLDRGIRVGMGTDGPASNDALDLFADLRLAAQLARVTAGDATALTAAEALWLATGAAADAIGRPDLGMLVAGRRADLVHVDTRDLAFEPVGSPPDLLAHLVWSGGGRFVRDVWVGGRQVVAGGVCTTVDVDALRAEVATRAARLAG